MVADRKEARRRVKRGEHAHTHIRHRAGSSGQARTARLLPANPDATMCRGNRAVPSLSGDLGGRWELILRLTAVCLVLAAALAQLAPVRAEPHGAAATTEPEA